MAAMADRYRRPSPDFVATDEALNSLLLGLEHLRQRLITAQAERNAKVAGKRPHGAGRALAKARVVELEPSPAPEPARQWYYSPEPIAKSA